MPETTLYPPPRPLSIGEVLDLAFRIYRATFVKCLVFGGLIVVARWLPYIYLMLRGPSVAQSLVKPELSAGYVLAAIASTVLALLFPVAIVCRQYRMVTGQAVGGEFLYAVKLLGRIVLIAILTGLAIMGCALLVIPAFAVTGVTRIIAFILLLLPMGYVLMRLACGFTAMVVEDKGASDSLGRSWQLTGGNVLRLTAIYTVAVFLLLVLYVVIGSLTAFLGAVFGRGDVAMIGAAIGVVTVAAGALASSYFSALGLAVFGDLLVRKEGADLSQRIGAV
jgi:glycerophosphoryl diester phosphodiesterase family protein